MKSYRAQIKDNKITGISVPVYFFRLKKRGVVFAECRALRIVTYGRNLEQAKKMFEEAFSLWKETVNETGDAVETLRGLGWQISSKRIVPFQKPFDVPIHLLDSTNLNLQLGRA